jgi:hypothetical protein
VVHNPQIGAYRRNLSPPPSHTPFPLSCRCTYFLVRLPFFAFIEYISQAVPFHLSFVSRNYESPSHVHRGHAVILPHLTRARSSKSASEHDEKCADELVVELGEPWLISLRRREGENEVAWTAHRRRATTSRCCFTCQIPFRTEGTKSSRNTAHANVNAAASIEHSSGLSF